MATEIKTWQIANGKLKAIDTSLEKEGRTEPYDLEPWIASNSEIVGSDICIIGPQVSSKSGPILNVSKELARMISIRYHNIGNRPYWQDI